MPKTSKAPGAILCVCLNPVIQKTLVFPSLELDSVNRASEHRVDASGKGVNVARVLTQIGRRAIHLTQVGGPTKDWFLALCAQDGLELEAVESGSEIRMCYTLVDPHRGHSTELVEEARPVAEATGARIEAAFTRILPEARALVISGTRAAGFPDGLFARMVAQAKGRGILVVLDIKGKDLLSCLPHRPDIVKPNLAELLASWPLPAGMVGDEAGQRSHVARVARRLFEEHGATLVVTRGSKSSWFFEGGELWEEATQARIALNPTGSGDSFTAGLTATLLDGRSLREAVAEGSRLGGLNAERLKPGTVLD